MKEIKLFKALQSSPVQPRPEGGLDGWLSGDWGAINVAHF